MQKVQSFCLVYYTEVYGWGITIKLKNLFFGKKVSIFSIHVLSRCGQGIEVKKKFLSHNTGSTINSVLNPLSSRKLSLINIRSNLIDVIGVNPFEFYLLCVGHFLAKKELDLMQIMRFSHIFFFWDFVVFLLFTSFEEIVIWYIDIYLQFLVY